jgi:HK97 gp10 family phage protein
MRRLVVAIARRVRDDVRTAARSVVQRRTGNLFKAIRSKRERGRPDVFEASIIIHLKHDGSPKAPHWHFIEFGTVKQRPRPFIAPTVKEWEPRMPEVYREEFGRQLERELAKRENRR